MPISLDSIQRSMDNRDMDSAERSRISRMFEDAEDLRDYPGSYFKALGKARAELAAWQAAHPEEAAVEKAEAERRAAERNAEREQNYRNSFIGKGID